MAEESMMSKLCAEFIGTYLLVFTIGCNILTNGSVFAATSIACVLMVSIYALGGVSGANFNPAVSVTLGLSKKLEWKDVLMYSVVQIFAGILAGLSYSAMFWKSFYLQPGDGFSWWEAALAEILYTFMLCFVVLNVATAGKNAGNQFFGLAIGFVIIAGGYAAGNISGGAFNPAVALGIDISSKGLGYYGWMYAFFELLGAALAAGYFRLVRPDEFGSSFEYSLGTKLASEFIGTFYLVLTVGLNILGKSPAPVWSIAAALMVMIYALGNCSGAHFNPAVTLAIMLSGRGKCPPVDGACYMGVQILGGIVAAFLYSGMHDGKSFPLSAGAITTSTGDKVEFGYGGVAFAEILFTFLLCYVVLCVATVREPSKDFFGLAIASCVTAGGYAIGAVSGGSLNPAVSFGISSSNITAPGGGAFYKCLIWSLFEFLGAGLAAGAFHVTHPSEYHKDLYR
jgi:aquaporin Z